MYYRGVNRGLSFTKPGVYAFGLVLVIGMIAVTTGINGLYVFLSAGLGGFIVSGLLSERAMKSCHVRSVAATMVDAQQPFTVSFEVENTSTWFSVFAMQNLFLLQPPKFRLISRPPGAVAAVRLTRLAPAVAETRTAPCGGLPRGEFDRVLVMQLTTFPFGILEKFKMQEVPASLIVAPALDPRFLEELRRFAARARQKLDAEKEFFSHRPYVSQDSLKNVDWKKSAAKPLAKWVAKQYRTPAAETAVRVEAPWEIARAIAGEAEYEEYLSRVRTALQAVSEMGRGVTLDLGEKGTFAGLDAGLAALARLPKRTGSGTARNPPIARDDQVTGTYERCLTPSATLHVGVSEWSWSEPKRGRSA